MKIITNPDEFLIENDPREEFKKAVGGGGGRYGLIRIFFKLSVITHSDT